MAILAPAGFESARFYVNKDLRLEADPKDLEEMAIYGLNISKMATALTSNLPDVHNLRPLQGILIIN